MRFFKGHALRLKALPRVAAAVIALLLCAGLFSCAAPPPAPEPTPTPEPMTATPAPATSAAAEPEPPPPEPEPWMVAYADALAALYAETGYYEGQFIKLLDLNFDNVPELLISALGTINTWTTVGYSYQNGQALRMDFDSAIFDANRAAADFRLYRDVTDGGLRWITHDMRRGGAGQYYYYHYLFDFTDIAAPSRSPLLMYLESLVAETPNETGQADYALYYELNEENQQTETTLDALEAEFTSIMQNYRYVTVQKRGASISDLCNGAELIDAAKLYDFFRMWDTEPPPTEPYIDPEILAAERWIPLTWYLYDTSTPKRLLDTAVWGDLDTLEAIRRQCAAYYDENNLDFAAVHNPTADHDPAWIHVYSLPKEVPERLFVVTGDQIYQWPGCMIFTYADGKLSPFEPDAEHPSEFHLPGASELRIVYERGMPFPILEAAWYNNQHNGILYLYRFTENGIEFVAGARMMRDHFTRWSDRRSDPIFDGLDLAPHEEFDMLYENGRLTPRYADVDGDGVTDIAFEGNFQCITGDYRVVASEPVSEVYLYNTVTQRYEFSAAHSVVSPLETYWHAR
jgi:hypothetical protein